MSDPGFPWRRRNRAYAANLLLDTKHALWVGEFRPLADGTRPDDARLVDPTAGLFRDGSHSDEETSEGPRTGLFGERCSTIAVLDPHDAGGLDLIDLLTWAAARGVAAVTDLSLLWDSERARDGACSRAQVAAVYELGERQERRRRQKTLAALRACRSAYLAAVA